MPFCFSRSRTRVEQVIIDASRIQAHGTLSAVKCYGVLPTSRSRHRVSWRLQGLGVWPHQGKAAEPLGKHTGAYVLWYLDDYE